MFNLRFLPVKKKDEDLEDRLKNVQIQCNSAGLDPWGLDPEANGRAARALKFIYRDYFRVETCGIENVPEGRVLMIANHGGQIPIDGMLITMAMMYSAHPPRYVRALVDRFVPSLPFIGEFFQKMGHVLGHPQNAHDLLEQEQCVLVFPEGTSGSGKTIFNRYHLQKFGQGFLRLATQTKSPIVPVAVIGSEETYPALFHLKRVAKMVGAPYLPVTPFFPAFGILGLLPLPCKITIRFGEPIYISEKSRSEKEIATIVEQIKSELQNQLELGVKKRGNAIFSKAAR